MKEGKLALLVFETVFSLTNLAFDLAKEQKPAVPDKPVAISIRMDTMNSATVHFIKGPIPEYTALNNFYNTKNQSNYILDDY